MIPIYPLLYACPRGDCEGIAIDSTLSPVPYPVIPSGVIRLVRRDSIIFFVIVVAALKISTLCTSYHQSHPPLKKLALSVAFHAPFEQTYEANLP